MRRPFSRARVSSVSVTAEGIAARSRREVVLDVAFDDRRIYSFWLHRDGTRRPDGTRLVPWPHAIRKFLDGTTRLTLTVHETGQVVHDAEVRLGQDGAAGGAGRIAVVNKDGQPLSLDKSLRLVQTFDNRSEENVRPLLDAIDHVLAGLQAAGLEPFLAYGTLLGAVRNGKLIGHDSDADLGYVSAHEHPVDAIRESFRVQRALVGAGYRITRYSALAFKVDVVESDGHVRGLDVFGGFMRDGLLHLMGEIRTPFRREWVTPLGRATLEGREFPVPADTDRFLAATYGKSWRVPDPAFHFATPASTRRRFDGWFRGIRTGRPQWDRFYSRRRVPGAEPSELARYAAQREDPATPVVDLGCGTGTDVLWFARRGTPATGLDFVRRAFEAAEEEAGVEDLAARFLTCNFLEARSALATGGLVGAETGPRVVLARHLADNVDRRARRNAWRAARMMLHDGGRLYVEFLVQRGDGVLARRERAKIRRPAIVARELRSVGARIVERETVKIPRAGRSGGSPTKICRMVATWE
ncbi:class I SAM-dependent methyltransferase [Nocardioides sp. URHA0032]|uniref:class I SAM-dependent methyltransferase n=1 Tax=Nocardioides sp. URHA0032 TaxID=1380388 RepID=UPI000685D147|nr:class I SAM-dependent methyltransferase [Nocardioides sp. URHA0032]